MFRLCEIFGIPDPAQLERRISGPLFVRWMHYLAARHGDVLPADSLPAPEPVHLSDRDLFFELARGMGATIVNPGGEPCPASAR